MSGGKRPTGPNSARRRHLKRQLAARDGAGCFYCGHAFGVLADATIDHLIPYSLWPTWRQVNLVLACGPCNHAKADRLPQAILRPSGLAPGLVPLTVPVSRTVRVRTAVRSAVGSAVRRVCVRVSAVLSGSVSATVARPVPAGTRDAKRVRGPLPVLVTAGSSVPPGRTVRAAVRHGPGDVSAIC